MQVLKGVIRAALLRLMQMAKAEEMRRIQARGAARSSLGTGCIVDFSKVDWKPGAALSVGNNSILSGPCIFVRDAASLSIGDRSMVDTFISCSNSITVGDDVLMAGGGFIADHNSHAVAFADRSGDVLNWVDGYRKDWTNVPMAPVRICDKAWIGFGVIILRGITIGEGAVVGAGSVVTKNVEPYSVVGGNPARLLRRLEAT